MKSWRFIIGFTTQLPVVRFPSRPQFTARNSTIQLRHQPKESQGKASINVHQMSPSPRYEIAWVNIGVNITNLPEMETYPPLIKHGGF